MALLREIGATWGETALWQQSSAYAFSFQFWRAEGLGKALLLGLAKDATKETWSGHSLQFSLADEHGTKPIENPFGQGESAIKKLMDAKPLVFVSGHSKGPCCP